MLTLLSKDQLSEDDWQQIESDLLRVDVGPAATSQILTQLRKMAAAKGASSPQQARDLLVEALVGIMIEDERRALSKAKDSPTVVMVVGVNGVGKTTSVAKLAHLLADEGSTVVIGAADTFRAAAVLQLKTWADKVGAVCVSGPDKADPASVAFDSLDRGQQIGADYVLIDTAGRLHTSTALMDELAKVRRVLEKRHMVDECLLVLDATTGQNGINQAKAFVESVGATGIVLTKLDGSARGGVIVAVEQALQLPVKYVGSGESVEDIEPFRAREFVEALVTRS